MPPQVRRAVIVLWVALLASIGIMLVTLDPAELGVDAEMAPLFWPFAVGSYVVNVVLVYLTSRRRNWARIVLLVLTVIGFALMVSPFNELPQSWASWTTDILLAALDLVAMYWLFTGPGAAWFSKVNLPR